MRKALFAAFLILVSPLIFLANIYALNEGMQELKLYMGEIRFIPVNQPTRIAIGNPEVADVISVTTRELILAPKAPGATTLVFWDTLGEHAYRVRVYLENIQEIEYRIDKILKTLNLSGVYTQATEEENKVILLGKLKTNRDREKINIALGTLKDKVVDLLEVPEEEAIVEIDAQVVELNKDATKILGFMPYSTQDTPLVTLTEATPSEIFVLEKFTRNAFTWKLDALAQEGKARILSRPRLTCQSGKEAELLVGGEKPNFSTYVTTEGGAGSTGSNIEYKEYGIKLKIKPTVTEEKRIRLSLNIEVSELEAPESLGTLARAYPLKKRTVSTELMVNDGQVLAIGGLVKEKAEEDIAKTPWLGDIPIIGLLFKKKVSKIGGGTGERGDSELFIALTPSILAKEKVKAKKEIATPTPKPQAKEGLAENALMAYSRLIQKCILENLSYPEAAKKAGYQGAVKLGLHFSYTGELLEINLKESSGYKLLDENAVYAAKSASGYPPFPSSIERQELWIDIPIIYSLD